MPSSEPATASPSPPARRRFRHHPWRLGLLGLALLVVAWGVVVGLRLLQADHRLRLGVATAKSARSELSVADLSGGRVGDTLTAAEADFEAAHADVTGILFAPLRVLPVVGTQVEAVADLSRAAASVTRAGATTLSLTRQLLAAPHRTASERLSVVTRLAGALTTLRQQLDGVDLGPRRGLLAPLAAKYDTFSHDLSKLDTVLAKASGATDALAHLLRGPSTVLVIGANNAEMRSGSGMALELGTLTTDDGSLHLSKFVAASSLVVASSSLHPTGDLAARWGFEHPTLDFRDLLLSPQFPPNAALAAAMWRARTGERVSGVILVDVDALRGLLEATGPISAEGTTIDASDVVPYLLEQQYAGVPYDISPTDEARQDKLGLLAAKTFAAIEKPSTSLTRLVEGLVQAADGRHVLAWSADPGVEADWTAAGVGGTVSGDDLLLGLINQGANKLDPYQVLTARVSIRTTGDDSTVSIAVTDRNATPTSVTGYAAGAAPRIYKGALALDFPRYAGFATVGGAAAPEAAGADYGADVLATPITVPDGASRTIRFRFVLLGRSGRLDVQPSARIPPTSWIVSTPGGRLQRFTDASAHAFSW